MRLNNHLKKKLNVMRFYNGGTCLSECLEESIEELNKKKD